MPMELARKKRRAGEEELFSGPTIPSLLLSLLFLLCFLSGTAAAAAAAASNFTLGKKSVSVLRLARIQRHLDKINKPAVRSIQSPDGDTVDCIHRHQQPAFDHPLLKNHIIQKVPPKRPSFTGRRPAGNTTAPKQAWQSWHHAGHCPKGTIPIRRSTVDDVLRAKSLFHYGKKQRRLQPPLTAAETSAAVGRAADAPDIVSGNGHEVCLLETDGIQL